MSNPDCALVSVEPAVPIAAWRGGKKNLARRIIARIEAIPHSCYAEPFCGMAGVFLRRRRKPRSEIINDINAELVNLFRIMREHPDELCRQFDGTLSSRREFCRLIDTPSGVLTDVQRAARFATLQRLSFGGLPATRVTPGQMVPSPREPARFSASRMRSLVMAVHRRLQGVHVECLEWDAFIARYDRPFTLFYVDPPYFGFENDYGRGLFAREDYARMAEILRGIRGRFILSINDRAEVREIFAGFDLEEVRTRYSTNGRDQKQTAELLISGGGGLTMY